MSDGGEAVSVEFVEGAVTNLHSMADTLRALRRLLDQKEGDGASIGADPALVQAVIVAGHEEMRSVRTLLAGVQPAEPWVQAANALARATSETDVLLDALEEAVRVAKD